MGTDEAANDSNNGELMKTLMFDDMQDTMHDTMPETVYGEDYGGRKNSLGSFSSGVDDSKSSRSYSSKQRSDGEFL